MTTPLDIINQAMLEAGVIGVGQTALAEDTNDAFTRLNWMMAQWARKRWLIWQLVTLSKISTGAQSYTVGPGGDFDIAQRPDKLESAFLRQYPVAGTPAPSPVTITVGASPFVYIAPEAGVVVISGGTVSAIFVSRISGDSSWTATTSPVTVAVGDAVQVVYSVVPAMQLTPTVDVVTPAALSPTAVDTPLDILESMEDYNRIRLKGLSSFSNRVFYDAGYPLGRIWPYPITTASLYAINITVKQVLQAFTSLGQTIDLPPEYMAALHYNMALRLRVQYNVPPPNPDLLPGLAKDALNVIRNANAQIPRMTMPTSLMRRGIYNPYSDGYN